VPDDLTCIEKCFDETILPENVTQFLSQTGAEFFLPVYTKNIGRLFDIDLFDGFCE